MKKLALLVAILLVTIVSVWATPYISVDNSFTPLSHNIAQFQINVHLSTVTLHVVQEGVTLNQIIINQIGDCPLNGLSNVKMMINGLQISGTVPMPNSQGEIHFNNCELNLPINSTTEIQFYADIQQYAIGTIGLELLQQNITAIGVNSNELAVIMGQFPIMGNLMNVLNYESILWVPSEYNSIQSAINASQNGDIIIVDPGSYFECINLSGKTITVASRYLIDPIQNNIWNTVICGTSDSTSIVKCISGESRESQLIGFHIINGNAATGHPNIYGGGIDIRYSSPTIKDCSITDNHASHSGGGISILNGNPRIQNCVIAENTSADGAGISVMNGQAEIINCTIVNNSAIIPADIPATGGLYLSSGSNVILANSIVWENYKTIQENETISNIGYCPYFMADTLNVVYSNIQGGINAINTQNNGTITWGEIMDLNPILDETYNLNQNSPCIDMGYNSFFVNGEQLIIPCYGVRPDIGWWESSYSTTTSNDDPTIPIINAPTLSNASPNPFNPTTSISYSLPKSSSVTIEIYNSRGQLIRTLVNETKSAGNYSIIWNGKDHNDQSVSSGIYFYKMKSTSYISTKKMVLMK